MGNFLKKTAIITAITIFNLLIGAALLNFGPARDIDDIIADANIRYFAPKTAVDDRIAIIFLDEATMKGLPYRSPVPRDFLYRLNEKLAAAGPTVIGYDIFFKDPTLAADDERLAASFKKSPVFAVSAGRTDEYGRPYEDLPMDIFANSLKGAGLSDLPFSSSDATVRRAQFEFMVYPPPQVVPVAGAMTEGVDIRPSFVAALYNAATGGRAEEMIHSPSRRLSLFGFKFPPYSGDSIRIRFAGPPSKAGGGENLFKIFPANLAADGLIPKDWLKDKIVMVGAAYDDGTDAYITPYYSSRYNYERMPGVEIHANILNQLLTGQFYYEAPKSIIAIGLLFVGLLSAILFLYGPIWRGAASAIILGILMAVKAVLYLHLWSVIIPIIPFEGSMLITLGACLGLRSVTEGRQKRFIKGVFAKYVPPSVVEKMTANPKLLTLGGEQRDITCMFTDIASFTTISERLDPKTLVSFLNEYLDKLTRIIFKYGGTLDKYEGDAIIAFFGAPLELPDHREAAVMAAIQMQKGSNEISEKWKDICGREIVTRIGIHSGPAVVGNMGSDLRFDYTAIGDTMNLASRLEGANKFFNTRILASEAVLSPSPPHSTAGVEKPTPAVEWGLFRPVANIKVKGKASAVKIYEVVGLKSELDKTVIDKIQNAPEPEEIIELTSK